MRPRTAEAPAADESCERPKQPNRHGPADATTEAAAEPAVEVAAEAALRLRRKAWHPPQPEPAAEKTPKRTSTRKPKVEAEEVEAAPAPSPEPAPVARTGAGCRSREPATGQAKDKTYGVVDAARLKHTPMKCCKGGPSGPPFCIRMTRGQPNRHYQCDITRCVGLRRTARSPRPSRSLSRPKQNLIEKWSNAGLCARQPLCLSLCGSHRVAHFPIRRRCSAPAHGLPQRTIVRHVDDRSRIVRHDIEHRATRSKALQPLARLQHGQGAQQPGRVESVSETLVMML